MKSVRRKIAHNYGIAASPKSYRAERNRPENKVVFLVLNQVEEVLNSGHKKFVGNQED